MRLLLPDFGVTDIQMVSSSPSSTPPANECPSDDEQPCYSKNVKADSKEGKKHHKGETCEEDKTVYGNKNNCMKGIEKMEQKSYEEESVCENRGGRNKEEKVKDGQDPENQNSKGEKEGEENESLDKDLFIRNSGLISHAYSLDLSLSPGGYSHTTILLIYSYTFIKLKLSVVHVSGFITCS